MTAPDGIGTASGVDVRVGACLTCGQTNIGQTGEHPCATCGLPTLHDPDSADELPSLEESRRELRAEGIDPDELGRRMRERVESMLRSVAPAPAAGDADARPRDPAYGLPVVGHGPENRKTHTAPLWRGRLRGVRPGELVDVLLDSGHIVRAPLRGIRTNAPYIRKGHIQVWVVGIGSYAGGRVRPADGWWRTPGCVRS